MDHDKKIMSGRLSTPRDVKDVRFSRISGTSGNQPFNDENNRQFSHDNPRLTNYGDNNHQKFLTPNDIKRQYDYRRGDSNNNRSILNKNMGNNNYLLSYQNQGETNDEYNRQNYSNLGDNNHHYYEHTYKDATNHHNLRYVGNSNCLTNVPDNDYINFGENNRLINTKNDENNHQLFNEENISQFSENNHNADNNRFFNTRKDGNFHRFYYEKNISHFSENNHNTLNHDDSQKGFFIKRNDDSHTPRNFRLMDNRQFQVQNNEQTDYFTNQDNFQEQKWKPHHGTLNANHMNNKNCQYPSDTRRQEHLGVQRKRQGPIKSNTSDTRLSFQSYDHSVEYDPIDISEEYNSAHNYHFGKKKQSPYTPFTYSIQSRTFANDNWPDYKPTCATYPVGVPCSKLEIWFEHINKNESFNTCIHQGILFHEHKIFIFSPILKSDIINNLMAVIHKEKEIHPSILQLSEDSKQKERKKILKRLMGVIANDFFANNKYPDISNCDNLLSSQYHFIKEKFSSSITYEKFQEKFKTMQMMVYYKMPVQRMNPPGRNCEWIKNLSNEENCIIRDERVSICKTPWHSYIQGLKEKQSSTDLHESGIAEHEYDTFSTDTEENKKTSVVNSLQNLKRASFERKCETPNEEYTLLKVTVNSNTTSRSKKENEANKKKKTLSALVKSLHSNATKHDSYTLASEISPRLGSTERKKENMASLMEKSSQSTKANLINETSTMGTKVLGTSIAPNLKMSTSHDMVSKNQSIKHTKTSSEESKKLGSKFRGKQQPGNYALKALQSLNKSPTGNSDESKASTSKIDMEEKLDDKSFSSSSISSDESYSSSVSSSSVSSGSDFLPSDRNMHDEIRIIPVYKEAIDISSNCDMGQEEASNLYRTLIELQQIEFGALNKIQCSSLNLTHELGLDAIEGYLPETYFTSKDCYHILSNKHFTVFKSIIHNLYTVWLPKVQKRELKYEPPPKSDMIRFLYIMAFTFLWDIGYQRVAFVEKKRRQGWNIPLGNLYNYCPCNKKFKKIFDEHIATRCSDSYFKKYASILTCDCEGMDTSVLIMKINLKGRTCIYHEATSLYLTFLYQDYFDTGMKLKKMNSDSSSDCEVLEVKMVPNESKTPTKRTSGKLIDSPIPKKAKSKKNIIAQKKDESSIENLPPARNSVKNVTTAKAALLPEKGESVKTTPKRNTLKKVSLPNKASKENFSTFPKKILRNVLLHETLLGNTYHDVLFEKQKLTNAQRRYIKEDVLTHGCIISEDDWEESIENYCDVFDQISKLIGSRTIEEHEDDELLSSYTKREAKHLLYPKNITFCNHILGQVLSRYKRSETRENAEKIGQTKSATKPDVVDSRINHDSDIDQFQLLRHFISAVLVLNPVWDIGMQNLLTAQGFQDIMNLPGNLTLEIHCPCSRRSSLWRKQYPTNYKCNYPIDNDKIGFQECSSGIFTDFLEFYKHITEFETKCLYHEALVDIISILYPQLYACAADKKKHKQLKLYHNFLKSNESVRQILHIESSLQYFSVCR